MGLKLSTRASPFCSVFGWIDFHLTLQALGGIWVLALDMPGFAGINVSHQRPSLAAFSAAECGMFAGSAIIDTTAIYTNPPKQPTTRPIKNQFRCCNDAKVRTSIDRRHR